MVFGNSQCKHCSNSFIALVLAFIFAGFALVLVLMYCNFTVADGTLMNGLIFYVNIIRIHHTILFPSGHINIVTVIIAWLNLDLGIELCFYNGFDTYTRTWATISISSLCLDHHNNYHYGKLVLNYSCQDGQLQLCTCASNIVAYVLHKTTAHNS